MFIQFICYILLSIIICMAQVPRDIVLSNFSTYIPYSTLEKLPNFIQKKSFDNYVTIIAIICFIIIFIPLFKKLFIKIRKYLYKNKTVKESFIQNEFISMLINDLTYSVQCYKSFCYNYNNIEKSVDLFKFFLIKKSSVLRKIKGFLNEEEYNFLIDYYNRNNQLLSYLKNLQKKSVTDIRTRDNKNRHINLNISYQKGAYDPNVIASCENEKKVILYIKELTEDAEYLINILRSKHIA